MFTIYKPHLLDNFPPKLVEAVLALQKKAKKAEGLIAVPSGYRNAVRFLDTRLLPEGFGDKEVYNQKYWEEDAPVNYVAGMSYLSHYSPRKGEREYFTAYALPLRSQKRNGCGKGTYTVESQSLSTIVRRLHPLLEPTPTDQVFRSFAQSSSNAVKAWIRDAQERYNHMVNAALSPNKQPQTTIPLALMEELVKCAPHLREIPSTLLNNLVSDELIAARLERHRRANIASPNLFVLKKGDEVILLNNNGAPALLPDSCKEALGMLKMVDSGVFVDTVGYKEGNMYAIYPYMPEVV